MILRPLALLGSGLTLLTSSALAQLQSLPVFPTAVLLRGTSVAVDYGRVLHSRAGVAQHLGARATLAVRRASLEIGAGLRDAGTDPDLQAAASAGFRLSGGGASEPALGLQLGAGYLSSGEDSSASQHMALPLSFGIAFPELKAGAAALRLWLAPRVQLNRVTFAQVIVNQPGAGGSVGVDVALPGRVGMHVAVDWSTFSDRRAAGVYVVGGSRLSVGAGAHLTLGSRAPAG